MPSSDQIGFRAAKYTQELGARDTSPSKAARFSTIRYLQLMRTYRTDLLMQFSKEEIKFLFAEVLPHLDFRRPNDIELLWVYTDQAMPAIGDGWPRVHHSPLVAKVKGLEPVLLDVLVDAYREFMNAKGSRARAWSSLWEGRSGQRALKTQAAAKEFEAY